MAHVECGLIRGGQVFNRQNKNGSTISMVPFRGIRFAKPPVEELRWRPPQKSECWEDTYDASNFGDICIQSGGEGSEDCLFLDIITPLEALEAATQEQHELLPVALYIHGGGLMGGDSVNPFENFLGEAGGGGKFVSVSINYRLNIFGFLATSELSKEQGGHSGNYGIMDQQAALEWVKENIASFGGDKDRITVYGQSSGGKYPCSCYGLSHRSSCC